MGKNQEKKEEKSGRKGKNRKGSFTLPLLTDRTGYATDCRPHTGIAAFSRVVSFLRYTIEFFFFFSQILFFSVFMCTIFDQDFKIFCLIFEMYTIISTLFVLEIITEGALVEGTLQPPPGGWTPLNVLCKHSAHFASISIIFFQISLCT